MKRKAAIAAAACSGVIVLMAVTWSDRIADTPQGAGTLAADRADVALRPSAPTDAQLQVAADTLLEGLNPETPDNAHLPPFARERLRWLRDEHAAGRLDVGFFEEEHAARLPPDVLMAASRAGGRSTIYISKPRLAGVLAEGGSAEPPFPARVKNDFAVALVHEVVHLQHGADPTNPETRETEELSVWRQVSVEVVRPLRSANQPIHQRFKDVDDVVRACRDELPCPLLTRLVRIRP